MKWYLDQVYDKSAAYDYPQHVCMSLGQECTLKEVHRLVYYQTQHHYVLNGLVSDLENITTQFGVLCKTEQSSYLVLVFGVQKYLFPGSLVNCFELFLVASRTPFETYRCMG